MTSTLHVKRILTRLHKNEVAWNQAITDAKKQLDMTNSRATRLGEIIADLERMRDSGELWPGLNKQKSPQEGG